MFYSLRSKGVLSTHAFLNANADIFGAAASEGVDSDNEVVDNSK